MILQELNSKLIDQNKDLNNQILNLQEKLEEAHKLKEHNEHLTQLLEEEQKKAMNNKSLFLAKLTDLDNTLIKSRNDLDLIKDLITS